MKQHRILFFLLLILIPCGRAGWLATGSPAMSVFVMAVLMLSAGYLAQFPFASRTLTGGAPGEKALAAAAIGCMNLLSALVVPALAAYAFHLHLWQLLCLYLLCLALFFAAGGMREPSFIRESPKPYRSVVLDLVFWGSLAAAVIMAIHYGNWMSGDYTWHGTALRKLRELEPISFRNVLLADLPYPQYGHNIWYLFLALFSYLTRLDTAQVWVNSSVYLPLVFFATFYVFSKELFRSSYWAKVSTILFLVYVAFLGIEVGGADLPMAEQKWSLDVSAYPSIVARYAAVVMYCLYLIKGLQDKKVYWRELLFASVCVALVHFFYVVHLCIFFVLTGTGMALLSKTDGPAYRRLFVLNALALLPAVAYLIYYKSLLDTPTVNPWFLSAEGMGDPNNRVRFLSNGWPFIHPWGGILRNPYCAAATAACVPLIASLFGGRRPVWKMFLALPPLALMAVFFNPPLMHLLQKFNPGLDRIWRLVEIMPVTLLPAGLLYMLQEDMSWFTKKTVPWVLAGLIAALMPVMIRHHEIIRYSSTQWEQAADEHIRLKGIVERYVPPGANIIADPQIAWTWTTMFPHYVYIHPYPGGLPPSYDPRPRIDLSKQFFEGDITPSMVASLRAANVEYIVLTAQTFAARENQLRKFAGDLETPVQMLPLGLIAIKLKPAVPAARARDAEGTT